MKFFSSLFLFLLGFALTSHSYQLLFRHNEFLKLMSSNQRGKTSIFSKGFDKSGTTVSYKSQNPSQKKDDTSSYSPKSSSEIPSLPLSLVNLSLHTPSFNLQYPNLRLIHADPPIFEIESFFEETLCDSFIRRAEDIGVRVASQTFSALTATARTSNTWYLHYKSVPELLSKAQRLTGIPIHHYEEPQIVRYELGQQFSWHYDAVPHTLLKNGGQRLVTLLVYLNDVEAGGATCFRDLNLKVQPKKGKALVFFPAFNNGSSDDRTLHAGQVAMDTKWIAQMYDFLHFLFFPFINSFLLNFVGGFMNDLMLP